MVAHGVLPVGALVLGKAGSAVPTTSDILKRHRLAQGLKQEDIANRLRVLKDPRGHRLGTSVPWVSRLEQGAVRIRPNDLPLLAEVYECDVLILLWTYPDEDEQPVHIHGGQLKEAPFRDPSAKDAQYWLPPARLKGSEMAVLRLQLGPGGRSRPEHSHPGEEMLFVTGGAPVLQLKGAGGLLRGFSLCEGDIVQFDGSSDHYIENPTDAEASLLIVRMWRSIGG